MLLDGRGGWGREVVDISPGHLHGLAGGLGEFAHGIGRIHQGLDGVGDAGHAGHNMMVAALFEAVAWRQR